MPFEPFKTVFAADGVVVKHMVLAPGAEVPWHFHSQIRDTFYVVCGPITIFTRDPEATTLVDSGSTFQIPERCAHRIVNESDHEVTALLIQGGGDYDLHPLEPR